MKSYWKVCFFPFKGFECAFLKDDPALKTQSSHVFPGVATLRTLFWKGEQLTELRHKYCNSNGTCTDDRWVGWRHSGTETLKKSLESCCGWFLCHTHLSSVQCQQSYNSCSGVWNTQSSCSHHNKNTLVRKLTCPFLYNFCDLITNVGATKCNDVTSRSIFSLLFSGRQSKII